MRSIQLRPRAGADTRLATVTLLGTATNAAIIDATNRVAGVGYLLPASTQGLATVAQVTAATNAIDATFIAAAGGVTGAVFAAQAGISGPVNGLLSFGTNGLGGGTAGAPGTNGANAYVEITNVVTLAAGSSAYASNNLVGTTNNITLGIPQGAAGAAGGLTNAVTTRIVTYDTTNPVITLAEGTNAWYWTPPTNVALSCEFAGPGAGWAGSGMLRLVRTNNDNSVTWPTNVAWIVNGTRTTNPPTLHVRNAIVVDYFDGMWGLGLLTTNAAVVP
jgi:hypothetical protein